MRFGRTEVLVDVSLVLAPGEIVAVLGESGSGKSSLLRLVAGLETPTAGEVRIDGRCASQPGTLVPPETRGVGLMFQDHALFPHLRVLDNVRFGLNQRPRTEALAVARARLTEVGLAHRAKDYPHTLSGGEAQRVALARALAPNPRLLLLDEPFSSLDRRIRGHVRADTLRLLRAKGTTALLVTHDPMEALESSDRVVLMNAGQILQVGSGEEIYHRPVSLLAARAIGETVEIEGCVANSRIETPLGALPAPATLPSGKLTICLRPEAIRIVPAGEGIHATILHRSFGGPQERLHLSIEGIAAPLALPVRVGDPIAAGPSISLALDSARALIFAAD